MLDSQGKSYQDTEAAHELMHRQMSIISALSKANVEHAFLQRLDACLDRAHGHSTQPPCGSPACVYCATDFASSVYDKAVALAESHRNPDGTFGVRGEFWSPSFFTSSGSLDALDLVRIHKWHAHDLRKIEGHPVIAGINPMYTETREYGETVSILCRFVALGPVHLTLEALQERLGDRTAVWELEPLTDPRSQLKALIELEATRTVTIHDNRGNMHRGELPLRHRHRSELAPWLDQYRFSDRVILKGLRWQGNEIVPLATRRKREGGE